ncbi:MAG: ATP-dependent DNA helicase RecG [Tenericutes bacterium HGW-Tenericutes-1]|nr:MAG: ATP-dependent DNA helicase RecG [Tenericutes bacterium HGW-Tenericutes-1]
MRMKHELLTVKGIGDAMLLKLKQNAINSIIDIIHYLPSRYEKHEISSIHAMHFSETITLKATIVSPPVLNYIRKRLTKLIIEVITEEVVFKIVLFNREFLKSSLLVGAEVVVTGKFENTIKIMVASDLVLSKNYVLGIIPKYGLIDISDKVFSKLVKGSLHINQLPFEDPLPDEIIKKQQLLTQKDMIKIAHFPTSESDILAVSRRIKYEELFRFGLRIALLRQLNDQIVSKPKKYDIDKVKHFIDSLPFELTIDQKNVTNDIFRDLKKSNPMLRLLQGDVGSGKTVCSMIAAYAVVTGHEQVAIMAPTEILAYQHYQNFKEALEPFGVQVQFLSSSIKGNERTTILNNLQEGNIHILVGTHSLIQEEINFAHLGFVIIDEQHRFGVEQRKKLRLKGLEPDVLLMSATPIPRTLSIAIFGDMDISSIKSMPIGRKKVITTVADFSAIDSVIKRVNEELILNHQAYFIVPVIDGKEGTDLIGVSELFSILRNQISNKYNIEILHGKLKNEEKNEILSRFYEGMTQVLVSTTVVEVGLNALKATVMTVINAERFGLSQLHQLRGRVGRNDKQSYCYFLSDMVLLGNNRLDILEKTADGFEISEEDLRQRGPGEVFGSEQTGIPKFRMANIIEDEELLHLAFSDASSILNSRDLKAIKLIKNTLTMIENFQLD